MSNQPVCFVFGAGDSCAEELRIAAQDLVIAADGGYLRARRAGIRVDVVIGDFDSLNAPPGPEEGLQIIRLPAEKDQTDMLAALQYGLERGFTRFQLYGGTGGRLDHTLANIQCLAYLVSRGARGYLHGDGMVITALQGQIWLAARRQGTVSVFAQGGPAQGVCLRGLKYPLQNARLECDFPLGVSNEFIGEAACIEAKSGVLVVTYPAGTEELEQPPAKTGRRE